jgi:hypothetical protein
METPLAEKLLDAFEYYYLENSALRLILTVRRIPGWENELKELMSAPEAKGHRERIAATFREVRAALRDGSDPKQGLEALLRVFPPDRNVN